MATGIGTITELRLEPEGLSALITCPPGLRPSPGQYLVASRSQHGDPLPVVIFPSEVGMNEIRAAAPLPLDWTVGTTISLRGPVGSGFRLPASARRVALCSLDSSPARLLPLASLALEQGAAVTLYAQSGIDGLPVEMEVLPVDLLPEAPGWADFLALEVLRSHLPDLRARLGLKPFVHPGCDTQVLVTAPMPCCGVGSCCICAVSTRSGWELACTDGPVFDFRHIEGG